MTQTQKDALLGLALGAVAFFMLGTWIIWYDGGFCYVFAANWACAY
jgi:hypothetical protein